MSAQPSPAKRLVVQLIGDSRAPAELPRKGRMTIGSDRDRVDFWVDGQGVDKLHCAIGRLKGGGWALQDLGSEFGTLLNGKPVNAKRLKAGDEIVIGASRLEVSDPEASGSAGPAGASAATAQAKTPSAPQAAAPARRSTKSKQAVPAVSGFRLQRPLGQGATGTVWLATQESLDREVALKVLSPQLAADRAFVQRFQDEARSAAALGHPNVVTVYDVGESDGLHYLAMEYMAGGSLEDHLAAVGSLPSDEVAAVLRDAAAGLEYAEGRGIVHRDIKPANLMRGEGGTIRIADLGLATSVESAVELGAAEGGKRRVQGTPHFLAPELVRGSPPGPRSDLYALGVTAFQLLCGQTPFDGKSSTDILKAALHNKPASLAALAPNASRPLVDLIERLIARDPNDRPASAAAVRFEALELLGSTSSAVPQAVVKAKSGSSKGLLAGGAILLIAAVGAWSVLSKGQETDDLEPNVDATQPASMQGGAGPPSGAGDPNTEGPATGPEDGLASAFGETPATDVEAPVGEEAEQRFEEKAELEYLRLGQLLLGPEERIERLRSLAETFAGSDTAEQALVEAAGLEKAVNTTIAEERALDDARKLLLDGMTAAAGQDQPGRKPGDALRALFAVEGQQEWAADEPFQTARMGLVTGILQGGAASAEGLLSDANDKLSQGQFELAREDLVALVGLVDLPKDMELEGNAVDAYERMRALAGQARLMLSNLEQIAADYAVEIVRADEVEMAKGFGGQDGLERDLLNMDLATALERLRGMRSRMRTPEAVDSLTPLIAGLEKGALVQAALIQGWSAGEWRRKTVLIPTGTRLDTDAMEATGIGSGGVQVEGGETISWSKLMGNPKALSNLLQGRLKRDWSPDEACGAATLVRVSGVLAAVQSGSEMFAAGGTERLTEREAKDLVAALGYAEEWTSSMSGADRQLATTAVQRERRAADLLARALVAVSEKRPSEAATLLERLLGEAGDTLLVRMLSDGSNWRLSDAGDARWGSSENEDSDDPSEQD